MEADRAASGSGSWKPNGSRRRADASITSRLSGIRHFSDFDRLWRGNKGEGGRGKGEGGRVSRQKVISHKAGVSAIVARSEVVSRWNPQFLAAFHMRMSSAWQSSIPIANYSCGRSR